MKPLLSPANIRSSAALVICACCFFGMAGCANMGSVDLSAATLKQQAIDAADAGAKDKALQLYQSAAKKDPTDAVPWLKMAQMSFDQADYPGAVKNSSEALARQPGNLEAKSLLAVSSLRLAAKALADLRADKQIVGSTRDEASQMAKLLREALGESVLVPRADSAGASRGESRVADDAAKRRPVSTPSAPVAPPPPSNAKSPGSPNPFGSLR